MKKILKFLPTFLLLLPLVVLAQENTNSAIVPPVSLDNPLGSNDVGGFVGNAINGILGIVGALSLFYFVLGGLTWMTSQGNQEKVKRGKETLIWATFGLAMIFFSYALVSFVLKKLIG